MKTDSDIDGAPPSIHLHLPDLALELLLAGEEPGPVAGAWRAHAMACERCASKMSELGRHDAAYRASLRAGDLKAVLRRAAEEEARARKRWRLFGGATPRTKWWIALPMAAAAGLVGIFGFQGSESTGGLRVKGQARLGAVVRHAGQSTSAAWDGRPLRPSDELQLAWASPSAGFLVVLAREQGGEALLLFPEKGEQLAGAAPAGPDRPIGASLSITAASRPFAVSACFSNAPLRIAPFVESVRRDPGTAGACPGELRVLTFAVETP